MKVVTCLFLSSLALAQNRASWMRGGTVTWDIPVTVDGKIPDAFLSQLAAIKAAASKIFTQGAVARAPC